MISQANAVFIRVTNITTIVLKIHVQQFQNNISNIHQICVTN